MSTSVNGLSSNFFPSPQSGFTTTTSGSVSSGATSVGLNSVAGFTNGDIAVFVIDPTDAAKKQTFTGVIDTSGVQVTSVKWTAGTNQTHALGATVVDYATATHIQMMTKGIRVQHNQDGTHAAVTATSVASTGTVSGTTGVFSSDVSDNLTTLKTIRSEVQFDFVASGCVWSGDAYGSTKAASMTAGVVYIGGKRVAVSAVTARTFTASKDVYVDVDNTGTLTYTDNTTNAASPALAANSIRLGIIVVGASNIAAATSVNQGQETMVLPIASSVPYAVTDSLGNLICPRDPNRRVLGYQQILTGFTSTTVGSYVDVTGIAVPVIVPTGRKIKVTVSARSLFSSEVAGNGLYVAIREGSTIIQEDLQNQIVANNRQTGHISVTFTPTAGLHTYKPSVQQGAAGTLTFDATSTAPAYLLVELV